MIGLQEKTYEQRLKALGITTLKTTRIRGDIIEMFKIINHYNIEPSDYFILRSQHIGRRTLSNYK